MKITKKLSKAFNSYWFNIALIVLISAVVLTVTYHTVDLAELASLFKNAKMQYLLLALIFVFLWQGLVGMVLTLITKQAQPNYRFHYGILNALIAALFHNITPSASGGQIAQVFVFHKQGIHIGDASSILWLEFIVYQSCLTLISFVFIVWKFPFFMREYSNLFIFVLLGFAINTAIIFLIYGLAKFEKLHHWIVTKGVNLGYRFKLVKDREKVIDQINREVDKFRKESARIEQHRGILLIAFLLVALRLIVYYSIPYLVLLALGAPLSIKLYFNTLVMSSFVSICSGMIPIPGASGGAEVIFVMMFSNIVSYNMATGAMLIWRGLTFYLMILIGLIAFIIFKLSKFKEY